MTGQIGGYERVSLTKMVLKPIKRLARHGPAMQQDHRAATNGSGGCRHLTPRRRPTIPVGKK